MRGHVDTSIALNTNKMWLGEAADMNSQQLATMRFRWMEIDHNAARPTDNMVRDLALHSAEDFRDNAPTSADQAAQIIITGVREKNWRILVGKDAVLLDQAIRNNPENAYEKGFFQIRPPSIE